MVHNLTIKEWKDGPRVTPSFSPRTRGGSGTLFPFKNGRPTLCLAFVKLENMAATYLSCSEFLFLGHSAACFTYTSLRPSYRDFYWPSRRRCAEYGTVGYTVPHKKGFLQTVFT